MYNTIRPLFAFAGGLCVSQINGNQNDNCVRDAMQGCQASDYDFTKFNCCHCVENALDECGMSIPSNAWPNWPVNPR
jgi:hypothetical protein